MGASLDFDGFDKLARDNYIDPEVFLPQVVVTDTLVNNAEQMDAIAKSFLSAEEARQLRHLARTWQTQSLRSLERQMLPLAYVPSLADKVVLFCINANCSSLEAEALETIEQVTRACQAVEESKHFLDLLAVVLQVANYVAHFGESDLEGSGFSLLNLHQYEDFQLGKHSFLSVVCTFLMNLRPGGRVKPRRRTRVSTITTTSTPTLERTASDESACSELPTSSSRPSLARRSTVTCEPNFVERLDLELSAMRIVVDRNVSLSNLEAHVSTFQGMARFVQHWLAKEGTLFNPGRASDEPAPAPTQRKAELVAWAQGRKRLWELHDRLLSTAGRLRHKADDLLKSERRLKEYAALRPADFHTLGYMDIFRAVVGFTDRLKSRWAELSNTSTEQGELLRTLLSAEPLGMIFASECLPEAFEHWKRKLSEKRAPPWDGEEKKKALRRLFRLFDTDGDGAVDAAEVLVTLKAFGISWVPTEKLHIEFVELFDRDGSGTMEFEEFQNFVESRIAAVFQKFLDPATPEAQAITFQDLRRVCNSLGYDSLGDEVLVKMINILDVGGTDPTGKKDGVVDHSEFEQLILMKPDITGLDVSILGADLPTSGHLGSLWLHEEKEQRASSVSDSALPRTSLATSDIGDLPVFQTP